MQLLILCKDLKVKYYILAVLIFSNFISDAVFLYIFNPDFLSTATIS